MTVTPMKETVLDLSDGLIQRYPYFFAVALLLMFFLQSLERVPGHGYQ